MAEKFAAIGALKDRSMVLKLNCLPWLSIPDEYGKQQKKAAGRLSLSCSGKFLYWFWSSSLVVNSAASYQVLEAAERKMCMN